LCSLFIYLAGVLGERMQYDLRKMLFNHLQELSLSYYSQNAVGRSWRASPRIPAAWPT
jgi:ABC-type bacteriocin/lantibiotic exporter with double-glycine peptidase domain